MMQKIIHIEDDLFFARMFEKKLQKLGLINLEHFEHCSSVLSDEYKGEPELIFIDHILQNELGANEIPKFKAKFKNAKIILLTGIKDLGLVEFAFSKGADKFFLKNEDLNNHLKTLFA